MAVRAIRGAITVENNDAVAIVEATKELLLKMQQINGIDLQDTASIIFTVTEDLDAAFPAVAARQLGWCDIALMCMREINVPGSLRMCIRVLMHVNTDKSNSDIKYVYLKGAVALRPDLGSQT